ncbi:MAG: hypothetical protein Q4E64_10565 [Phascolarctobacterium sp.]|uniref:hypothetical protein n=1 Tax=Phascolarctobacterium sp. TaxID=2049039 RepID=UPI0026DA8FB0|nr:hypothetical protein [Phascolarctobacterium sp.]MDO4922248.1 hypothetical protein [Phascolarctobacterium sp.]
MKFVIVSPRQNGGGAIALHILCRELLALGVDASILYFSGEGCQKKQSRISFWKHWLLFNIKDNIKLIIYILSSACSLGKGKIFKDYFYEPIKGCKRKILPYISQDTVVVYPDMIYGNHLNANKVVRWLLYFNRFPNDDGAYGKGDLFFCYRDIFNDYKLNPECKRLWFQNFDFNLYKKINYDERKGCCYIVRKGKSRRDLPSKFAGPIIDNWSEEAKVEAFNKYKKCYFYDTQTFYTIIAAVCGCIPVVVLEAGKSKKDYLSTGERPLGVAYGEDEEEISFAIDTRVQCIANLKKMNERNILGAQYFLEECKKYFV